MAGTFLAEYAATIGLDAFKDKIEEKMDQAKLSKLIEKFLEKEKSRNYRSSLAEEIDFEGFCDYARSKILEDIQNYIFSEAKDREGYKQSILIKAVSYAQANNRISKNKVEELVLELVDILYHFYRNFKTDKGTLLLAVEIERKLDSIQEVIVSAIGSAHDDLNETITTGQADIGERLELMEAKVIEHGDKNLEQVKNVIAETAVCEQKERSIWINSYIDAKRKAVLDYTIFPWFKDSPKYHTVFPQLFVDPVFKQGNNCVQLHEVCEYADEHIAILGEAGAGKSTLLRYLFAFSKIENKKCLYITAKEANKENILDKISENLSATDTEKYLVYIDGIDEEFAYDYEGFRSLSLRLQKFVNVAFWLGCRTDYYERNYNEDIAFVQPCFTIEPWTSEQSDYFIEQYSKITENYNLKDIVEEMVGSHEMLQAFKSNPFQLSLLMFLAENKEKTPIWGIYDLYERFVFRWIERENKRETSMADGGTLVTTLTLAATKIYAAEDYRLDDVALNNSAIRNLLVIHQKSLLSYTYYASAFYHRSLAAFLLAHSLVEAFLNNEQMKIRALFNIKLKDDVTNFVGNKFATLTKTEKQEIKKTLIGMYTETKEDEISIKEQIVYYITRLGIDVTEFLSDLIKDSPEHPIMRLTIAYGCVLTEDPYTREFALEYARSLAADTVDARTNRAWTVIYFGDVNDRDPYTYADDEHRQWQNARQARIKRFTKENPRLKDYRFRLFDIPLFHSFLKDRNWNDITLEEYDILDNIDFPGDKFTSQEILFLNEEKAKLLEEYRKQLEN